MALETFSYITSLNASNPIHATDDVSQGDDHIRGVKSTLLSTFPNLDAAVTCTPTEANRLTGLTGLTGTGELVASISPTFTGALTAAAIVATTYDGIAAADLLDKSAVESISGVWTFDQLIAGALTATSYDGILSGNIPDATDAGTISGLWHFSTSPQIDGIELGHASDTTISREAAGIANVEGKVLVAHNDAALGSGEIHISTSAPSGGADGDIWLEREA